jgi:hypothetical protein
VGVIMISVDEKTEAELEKDISEAVGALGDGWELRFMLSRHILTVGSQGGSPKSV